MVRWNCNNLSNFSFRLAGFVEGLITCLLTGATKVTYHEKLSITRQIFYCQMFELNCLCGCHLLKKMLTKMQKNWPAIRFCGAMITATVENKENFCQLVFHSPSARWHFSNAGGLNSSYLERTMEKNNSECLENPYQFFFLAKSWQPALQECMQWTASTALLVPVNFRSHILGLDQYLTPEENGFKRKGALTPVV